MRLIKTLDEIKGIRKANQIIAKIYTDIIPPYLKPGITTREIDRIIDEYIRSCGARPACIGVEGIYGPFPAATCISVNEEVVHGVPGDRVIKEGDIVKGKLFIQYVCESLKVDSELRAVQPFPKSPHIEAVVRVVKHINSYSLLVESAISDSEILVEFENDVAYEKDDVIFFEGELSFEFL